MRAKGFQLTAVLLLGLLVGSSRADTPPGFGRISPNSGLFPDSSLIDFRHLLDGPSGKHGFLSVNPEGHFLWPNGKRAKFWGINVSNKSIFVDTKTIDRVVDVFAHAGLNMVRLEAVDSLGGLLDTSDASSSRMMDPAKLKTLDYWVAKLKERGIYYYFDLLDFRQFKSGDDVPNYEQVGRAAKPYAFFDRRMVDLQKEFAKQFLQHKNVYTNLRYVDDPGLALLEICNEHGLFFKAANLDTLVEPYGAVLRQQWNRWLLLQYGSREGIKRAWGNVAEAPVLSDSEDPGAYAVNLPMFTPAAQTDAPLSALVVDVRRAPTRLRDGVRFLYETQRGYFREMKSYLREIGVRVPITGVVSNDMAPDIASAAAELDFTSENYYSDHPSFSGKEWEGSFFCNDTNPLRQSSVYQIAPWLGALRWENKPVVVREWATVWPNRYRSVSVPEMAAYCSLQDFDAVLLFGYSIGKDPEKLGDFNHQCDPLVWGLISLGSQAFLHGDIKASPNTANLQYSFDSLLRWPSGVANIHRLAWFVRINSAMLPTIASIGNPPQTSKRKPPRKGVVDLNISSVDPNQLQPFMERFRIAGAAVNPKDMETGNLVSSTGQICRNTLGGYMTINAPKVAAISGEFVSGKTISAGALSITTTSQIGTVMAVALDDLPLDASKRYIIKMVTRAENTDQALEQMPVGAPGKFRIQNWGKAPVLTFGKPAGSVIVTLAGRPSVNLQMTDGSWELCVENGKALFSCDTAGITGAVYGNPVTLEADKPIMLNIPPARTTLNRWASRSGSFKHKRVMKRKKPAVHGRRIVKHKAKRKIVKHARRRR